MIIATLQGQITRILYPFAVPEDAHSRILLAYTENWRTYHNADHILEMLELSRHPDIDFTDEARQRLELMIIYHDAWYKVGRLTGENEEQSARWAVKDLFADANEYMVRLRRAVKQGILATATHKLDNINSDYVHEIATLLDLDLWGLGQSAERFREDTEKVWREYQPIVTRQEFDAGRAQWARSFLESRSKIYHTETFHQYEEAAQRNLRALAY